MSHETNINPTKSDELGQHATPIAEHLGSVILEQGRSVLDKAKAAVGLQMLRSFFPAVSVPPGGTNTSMPGPDVPGTSRSHIEIFSNLSASEQIVAGEALTLVEEFVRARSRALPPEGHTMVMLELIAELMASACRYAQEISAEYNVECDPVGAHREMQQLVLERCDERLRNRNLALS